MKYLTLRWFTLNCFDESKLKTFHSLERAINADKKLCWHTQTENYLKQEFKNFTADNNTRKKQFEEFENNLQKFFTANNLEPKLFLENINFIHKCDEIIYHKAHRKNTLRL